MTGAITPRASSFDAVYFDGLHPIRRAAAVQLYDGALHVCLESVAPLSWPYSDLRVACDGSYGEPVRLELRNGTPGETILIEDEDFLTALRQYTPVDSHEPPLANIKGWPAVLLTCAVIAAFGSIAYFWGVVIAAQTIATVTPPPVEERLGRAVTNILAPIGLRCNDPAREAILARVSDPLIRAAGPGYNFRIIYTNHPIPNAFAAPGGYIVVFQGLLQQTQTPEEYAGVLAHEITHVLRKHTTRALARHVSTQTLLSLMAMDSAGTPAALEGVLALGNLRYQRDDEDEADMEGLQLLTRAGIQPGGLVTFFRRLHADPRLSEPSFSYFSSHPALLDRAHRIESEVRKVKAAASSSLLSPEEWAAARRACVGSGM